MKVKKHLTTKKTFAPLYVETVLILYFACLQIFRQMGDLAKVSGCIGYIGPPHAPKGEFVFNFWR